MNVSPKRLRISIKNIMIAVQSVLLWMSYRLVFIESRDKQNVLNCTSAQDSSIGVKTWHSTASPCALYIAPSNLLGTKNAWFAGVDFRNRDLIGVPNVVVTLIDHP